MLKIFYYLFKILLFILPIFAFFFGVFVCYSLYVSSNLKGIEYSECNNESIFDFVECLNKDFNEFYKYNESNMGKILSFKEFKEQGGVCIHASVWYIKQLKNKGYEITPLIINRFEKQGSHAFVIASSKEGYCLMEQGESFCVPFDI